VSGASVATLPIGSALGRLLLATAYTLFSMLSVVGVATLVGVATENALAAMSSGIGLYIVSAILDALPGLSRIHPLLPVHYLEAWTNLFVPGGSLEGMLHGVISAGSGASCPFSLPSASSNARTSCVERPPATTRTGTLTPQRTRVRREAGSPPRLAQTSRNCLTATAEPMAPISAPMTTTRISVMITS